jgi:hypothetical protein
MGIKSMKIRSLQFVFCVLMGLFLLGGKANAQFLQWNFIDMITDTVESGAYSDMKIAPDGTIHISYWQRVEGKLIYAWKAPTDVTWHREYVNPLRENGFRSSICLDGTGVVHVAYYENVNGTVGIRYARRQGPSNWVVESLPDIYGRGYGDYGPLGTNTSKERIQHSLELIFDENNKPQIVFFDGWMRVDAFPACVASSEYGFKLHQGIRVNNLWLVRSLGEVPDIHSSCGAYATREPLPHGDRYGEYLDLLIEPDGTMDIFSLSRFNTQLIRHRTLFPYVDTVWVKTDIDSLGRIWPTWRNAAGGNFTRFYTIEGISASYCQDGNINTAYSTSIFYGDNYCCVSTTNNLIYCRLDPNGIPTYHNFGTSTYRNFTDITTRGGSDSLFLLYADLSTLYFIVQQSADSGVTWVADTVMQGVGIGRNQLEIYQDSLLALIFDASNERLVMAKRHVNGGAWRIEEVTHSQARGQSMDAAYMLAGNDTIAHVAFNDGYNGALYYASGTKATGWNWAIEQLNPSAIDAIAVSLANTVAGEPVIIYNGGVGRDLLMAVHSPGGWEYDTILPGGNPLYTDLAISSLDTVHVVYYDGNQDCLHHASRHLLDSVWTFVDITCDTSSVGLYPCLVLDAAGLPHVSYYNDIRRSLDYGYLDGGSRNWVLDSIAGGSSSAIGKFSSMVLDAAGYPKIAYLNEQDDAVSLTELGASGLWTYTTVDSQSISNIGRPIELQLDDFGKVWIAYNYYSNFEKVKLMHRDGPLWREVSVNTTGRIANAFKFKIIGGDFFIVGKKNEIQNTGMAMLYSKNGVFVEANEANLLSHNVSISSFPNPSNGQMTFELEVELPAVLNLEIMDLLGHKVGSVFHEQRMASGKHAITFDGSSLAPGIYLYELRSSESRMVSKIVIAR